MEELAEELQAFSISIAGEFKEANMWADEKERYKPNSWPYHLKAMDDYPNDMGLFTQLGTMSEYKDPNLGFMLHSTVDLFDLNRSINIFNPFKHGKITDENGRRIK